MDLTLLGHKIFPISSVIFLSCYSKVIHVSDSIKKLWEKNNLVREWRATSTVYLKHNLSSTKHWMRSLFVTYFESILL